MWYEGWPAGCVALHSPIPQEGQPKVSHVAQLMLWIIARYLTVALIGILTPDIQDLKPSLQAAAVQAPQGVRRVSQELASLLVKRNELAAALAGGGNAPLPPMLRDPSAWGCGRCYMVNACSVAHKVRGGMDALR